MPAPCDRVLITGATGAVGGALARLLAAPGRRIALNFNSSIERAEALRDGLGPSVEAHLVQGDLSREGVPERIVARSAELMGGIGLIAHCAAGFERTPLGEVTPDGWERSVAINMRAPFFLAQAAAGRMKESGGAIVFVTDVAAARPYAGYLPYCMAKAGVEALVRGLARALAPQVRINAVAPYIVTRPEGMEEGSFAALIGKTPLQRAQTAGEIAAMIRAVAESESMTGQVIAVESGRLLR